VVSPDALKPAIHEFMPDFNGRRQHDAFECFLQHFELLYEDLKLENEDKSIRSVLFQSGIIAYRRFKCGYCDPSDDQPYYLIVPLAVGDSPLTLASYIREWTRREGFDGDNPLWCSRCRCLEAFQMQVRVKQLVKYVVVQFLRFNNEQCRTTKDSRPVDYPLKFSYIPLLNSELPTINHFLVAVVCHSESVHDGHYHVSFMSLWYPISDSHVSEGSEGLWKQDNAYIMLYEADD
jgi:ubiquitin C-terminal hydrolase